MKSSSSSSSSDSSHHHHHHHHHHQLFDGLSESLLVEILVRVPSSREVNQLKLVCKLWNSLISSHYFVTFFNHRRHDPSLPPFPPHHDSSYSLVYHLSKEIRLVRYRYTGRCSAQFDATRVLDLSFLPIPQSQEIEVQASCADLILCSYKNKNKTTAYFYVCNPLTKQWAALPPASVDVYPCPGGEAVGLLCVPSPCSLCRGGGGGAAAAVDKSPNKFTVVRILKCNIPLGSTERLGEPISEFNFELYSSEDGQWRSCVVTSPRVLSRRGGTFMSLVAYRGMLHWLVFRHILVYDPYNSPTRFSRIIDIPPPHTLSLPYSLRGIGVRHDRLHLAALCLDSSRTVLPSYRPCRSLFNERCIWELEDYDTGKWSLAHKFPHGNQPYSCVREDLVDATGHTNPQSLDSATWLNNWLERTRELNTPWYSRPDIVYQWWPTPVLSPPLKKRRCTTKS